MITVLFSIKEYIRYQKFKKKGKVRYAKKYRTHVEKDVLRAFLHDDDKDIQGFFIVIVSSNTNLAGVW